MDFTQLRYFHEVARAGTIRKASERLNIAASALSRQIQQLEHQVGMVLFDRNSQGMRLTPAGEIYARHAKLVMLDEERARQELAELKGLKHGKVRVVSAEGVVSDYLMQTIAAFRGIYPGVSFELGVLGTDDIIRAVRNCDADIGLAFNGRLEPEIEFRLQVSDRLCAICAPSHPIASRKSINLRDMAEYPLAIPVTGFGIRALVDEACRVSRLRLQPALQTNCIDALRAFAANGIGLSVITQMSVRQELASGQLCAVPLTNPTLRHSSIDVLVLSARRQPPAVEAFLKQLRDVAIMRKAQIVG
jgi:DNA-binding transcriptional LysR family regulator